MTVAVLAFDLDGTILEPEGTIAAACAAEITRLADLGVRCVVASGRSLDFQVDLLQRLGLARHFDALISDERWVHLNAPRGQRSDQVMELQPLEPWNTDTRSNWTELDPIAHTWCLRLEQWGLSKGWSCTLSDQREAAARGLRSVRCETGDQSAAMMRWLEPQLEASPLGCNANGSYVHVYDQDRDKGTSLLALTDHLGVAPQSVFAFGDGFNDQPMLDGRHQFRAATVANAAPEAKRWVIGSGGQIAEGERGLGIAQLLQQLTPSPESATPKS